MMQRIAWYLRDSRNLHYFATMRPYLEHFTPNNEDFSNRLVVSSEDPTMDHEDYRNFKHLFSVGEKLENFDLVVTPSWLRPGEHPSATPVVQIFHGISDKPFTVERDFSQYAMTLCIGQQQVDRLRARPQNRSLLHKLVGYAKFDNPPKPRSPFSQRTRPVLIYAPTWRKGGFSSIERFLEPGVVESLVERYDLLIKPHPNVFNPDRSHYDEKIVEKLAVLDARDDVSVVQAGNILPYFAAAAICIADISSAGYEWLWFNRPVVFLNPDPERFEPDDEIHSATALWRAGEVCNDPRALAATVDASLDSDKYRAEREQLLSYNIHMPQSGSAAARGAEAIRGILGG